jgi:hypothetical protein
MVGSLFLIAHFSRRHKVSSTHTDNYLIMKGQAEEIEQEGKG